MTISKETWEAVGKHLGYSPEELELFKNRPKNQQVMEKAGDFMKMTLVATVKESHGCNSGHKVGDRICFDGAGNLLTEKSPARVCMYALGAIVPAIHSAGELVHAGKDPNEMIFNRFGCPDVGVGCGGWGRIVVELSAE